LQTVATEDLGSSLQLMEAQHRYKTIEAPATAEFKDRGSRFLAFAYPVRTNDQIKDHIRLLKKEHPKAVHHCVAFRLGTDGSQYRAYDDGEPAGSAGKPMLGQIDSAGLTNVLVVVVRYFGGTLLGVPGLINAYKTATQMALDIAPKVDRWLEEDFEIQFDYPAMGEVLYLLKQAEATIHKQELQLFCMIETGIPKKHSSEYLQRLMELQGVKVAPLTR
jgi:uncharacterized YigZ family protein